MRAVVDENICIGCGMCAGIAPESFRMTEEGKAECYEVAEGPEEEQMQEAIEGCPVSAIAED